MNKICAVEASRDSREADSSLLRKWQVVHRLRTEHCFNYTLRQKKKSYKIKLFVIYVSGIRDLNGNFSLFIQTFIMV